MGKRTNPGRHKERAERFQHWRKPSRDTKGAVCCGKFFLNKQPARRREEIGEAERENTGEGSR